MVILSSISTDFWPKGRRKRCLLHESNENERHAMHGIIWRNLENFGRHLAQPREFWEDIYFIFIVERDYFVI